MKWYIRKPLALGFLLLAAMRCPAETQASGEALLWEKAVACRARSFTMAPGILPYEQYQLDRDGTVAHRETGRMQVAYDENGKAAISIQWAWRDDKDFTAERARRLQKQTDTRNSFLSLVTPFDPDIQEKLQRKPGTPVYEDGKPLWQYEFTLPVDAERSLVGTARVYEDGTPHDVRYTQSPLPWFLDRVEIHIVFDTAAELLLFRTVDYSYEASFLFWLWRGGGYASFDDWKRISAPPRLN